MKKVEENYYNIINNGTPEEKLNILDNNNLPINIIKKLIDSNCDIISKKASIKYKYYSLQQNK